MNKLLSMVSKLYGLSTLKVLNKIDIGYTSTNYILGNDKDKYFLKQYDSKFSEERVIKISSLMKYFDVEDIPTVMPLITESGRSYFEYNARIYSLFPFVEGEIIENKDLSNNNLYKIGLLHGKLLSVGKDIQVKDKAIRSLKKNYEYFLEENKLILSSLEGFDEKIQNIVRGIQAKKEEYYPSIKESDFELTGQYGLTHGDYWQRNILFRDDKIVGLIDFDKIGSDFLSRKLMRGLEVICFSYDYSDREYIMAESYLKGVLSTFEVSREKFENSIHGWRTSIMLNNVILKYLVLRNNMKFVDLLDVNLKRVIIWGEEFDIHKNKLLEIFDKYNI